MYRVTKNYITNATGTVDRSGLTATLLYDFFDKISPLKLSGSLVSCMYKYRNSSVVRTKEP